MKAVRQQVADWIDPDVISSVIVMELEDNGIEATLANAQRVWLDALEELHHLVTSSIDGLSNRGEI
jgi:hypothetical protein